MQSALLYVRSRGIYFSSPLYLLRGLCGRRVSTGELTKKNREIKMFEDCENKVPHQSEPCRFVTKDSGKREEFPTGMVRDIQTDKPRYDLVDWPMIKRWAELMQRGALKSGEHNWK